ncbi:MAG: type III pantothenate kinase [Bacteroidales bacterium]|nr:type III pantothenate kinase [Bacteroidales bacterium]MBO7643746.1 type III pantothenate kinase [Bacteroidales bacterium]
MSNLLIEIGNTAVKAAWSEGSVLGKTIRYQGERIMEFISSITEKQLPAVMAVVSVRRIEDDELPVLERSCQHLLLLDPAHPGVLADYGMPDYLTYDRACTVVAAKYLFRGKPCSVFDFGTTLTVDFTDAAGNYLGGNVSPGCLTRFKALNRYSKALPLLSIPSEVEFPGTSGKSAIESGVISGIMFEMEGYIRSFPENVVIFTGGDAIYFAKRMKNSIFAVCNLGLMGMAIITDEYVKKNIQ